MFDKFFESLTTEVVFGLLAVSGGIARILVGTGTDPNITFVGEAARLIFVALPIGVICGLWVQDISSSDIVPLAASFAAGVLSLNVVRFMLSDDGLGLLKSFIKRFFDDKR